MKLNTKIWNVKFGNWTNLNVTANNIKQAIQNAQIERKHDNDNYLNRIQDITEVNLVAETG